MYAKAQHLLLKDSCYGEECLDRVWQKQRQKEQTEVAAIVWAKGGGAGTTTVAVKMERSEWIYRTYFAGRIPELAAGMGAVREE